MDGYMYEGVKEPARNPTEVIESNCMKSAPTKFT